MDVENATGVIGIVTLQCPGRVAARLRSRLAASFAFPFCKRARLSDYLGSLNLSLSQAWSRNETPACYLIDHLAGSVGALDMLDGLIQSHEGKPLEPFLTQLRRDIESDQNELKELMKHVGIDQSAIRKAGAWITEKLSRTKLGPRRFGGPKFSIASVAGNPRARHHGETLPLANAGRGGRGLAAVTRN